MAKVLIIEDDDVIAQGMARHLQAAGFDAVGVANGTSGASGRSSSQPRMPPDGSHCTTMSCPDMATRTPGTLPGTNVNGTSLTALTWPTFLRALRGTVT